MEEQIPIDYWWMDAGWYPCDGHWPNTGTWEPDLTRFPNGLRAISDHALAKGVKTLVWFEPERVGGRRNDLETMRRAVPLHPTDYNYGDLAVKQAFHHSLYQWIPYFGSNTVPMDRPDSYAIRSGQSLSTTYGYDMRREDFDYARLRQLTKQLKQTVPYYYGDFYPPTPYSLDQQDWIVWQFHVPDRDEGMVQAFRRSESEASTHTFQLGGLDPGAQYSVHDLDQDIPVTTSGRELIETGLSVSTANRPGAVVIYYSRTE